MHGHTSWAEVAPLAPLIVPLGEICAFAFVIGCIWVLRGFLEALLGALGHVTSVIPFIGGIASGVVHRAERAITTALGNAEQYFDNKIGAALHELARIVDWTYRELERHSGLLVTLIGAIAGPAVVGAIRASIAVLHGNVHAVTRQVTGTYARVLNLEHRLQHTITAGVLPRLGRLEREYDHIIDKDIAGLRARTKGVEKSLDDVWKYVRAHPWTVVTDAFVGAVAVALSRLGLNWLRCPTANNFFNKRGCNAWADLEALLALGEVVGLLSLVELAKEEQAVISAVASGVRDVLEV